MSTLFTNTAGYADTTAGKALSHIIREEKVREQQAILDEMKNRPRVYVVSKYRGNVDLNTIRACDYCRYVISKGKMPIASHLLYPQFLNDNDENQRKMGCQFGLALLSLCDEVWVFNENRELSDGMRAEIREARILGKPVKYHDVKGMRL